MPIHSRVEKSFEQAAPFASQDSKAGRGAAETLALVAAGIAAFLAGACCVAPLLLVTVGLGGAWLANFQVFEPYRPLFIGIAFAALVFAGWRSYRPAADCGPGDVCAVPGVRRRFRVGFWIVAALLLMMLGYPYLAPFLY